MPFAAPACLRCWCARRAAGAARLSSSRVWLAVACGLTTPPVRYHGIVLCLALLVVLLCSCTSSFFFFLSHSYWFCFSLLHSSSPSQLFLVHCRYATAALHEARLPRFPRLPCLCPRQSVRSDETCCVRCVSIAWWAYPWSASSRCVVVNVLNQLIETRMKGCSPQLFPSHACRSGSYACGSDATCGQTPLLMKLSIDFAVGDALSSHTVVAGCSRRVWGSFIKSVPSRDRACVRYA